jgi:hypothetical protein
MYKQAQTTVSDVFKALCVKYFVKRMADAASDTDLQHLKSLYPYGEVSASADGNIRNSYRAFLALIVASSHSKPVVYCDSSQLHGWKYARGCPYPVQICLART